MSDENVEWVITCYSKESDVLVEERRLAAIDLPAVRKMFNLPPDDPVCDACPINKDNAEFFKQMIAMDFDFNRFEYYLESNAL